MPKRSCAGRQINRSNLANTNSRADSCHSHSVLFRFFITYRLVFHHSATYSPDLEGWFQSIIGEIDGMFGLALAQLYISLNDNSAIFVL